MNVEEESSIRRVISIEKEEGLKGGTEEEQD